ncbi:MAG TPA: ATP-binding protein [Bacteroidia bacterium]|nr:ATP-binding protein [Bacteroidia bacterium]
MIELWGKQKNDVVNKPLFVGVPEAKEQGFEDLLEGVYTTFAAEGVPVTLLRNGKIANVFVNFVFEAYREVDGIITGVLAVAVDVTTQVIAHQKIEEAVAERTKELADANNDLQKSNDELAQFAYIASHDLQEPLRKIGTFTQMLEKSIGDKVDVNSKNYFTKIKNSTQRMNVLIRDVLAYSELVKQNDLYKEVDLNKVLESVKADYDLLIEEKGASIVANQLPTLNAIPLQMSQLFGNIIGNALKFARKDIKPHIKITASKLDLEIVEYLFLDNTRYYWKIEFADNGIGFKAEYADQIFNVFQRLHRKSEYEGTGIGLAMCKKIALNHHGNMSATDSSENGAVFNVILPFK